MPASLEYPISQKYEVDHGFKMWGVAYELKKCKLMGLLKLLTSLSAMTLQVMLFLIRVICGLHIYIIKDIPALPTSQVYRKVQNAR